MLYVENSDDQQEELKNAGKSNKKPSQAKIKPEPRSSTTSQRNASFSESNISPEILKHPKMQEFLEHTKKPEIKSSSDLISYFSKTLTKKMQSQSLDKASENVKKKREEEYQKMKESLKGDSSLSAEMHDKKQVEKGRKFYDNNLRQTSNNKSGMPR